MNYYSKIVLEEKETPWNDLRGQIYLGSERFVEQMQARIGPARPPEEVPLRQRRALARPLAYYAERYEERERAMAQAWRSGAYSLREIGAHFGVGRMTVSRAVNKHEISRNKMDVPWETCSPRLAVTP